MGNSLKKAIYLVIYLIFLWLVFKKEWILIFIKAVDRIYRINRNFFARFPDENGQTLSPSAKRYYPTTITWWKATYIIVM